MTDDIREAARQAARQAARERITGIAGKTPAKLLHNSHAHAGAVTAQEIERAILSRITLGGDHG